MTAHSEVAASFPNAAERPIQTHPMPTGRRIRHLMSALVWSTRPSLFYYAANRGARQGICVRTTGNVLEVVRPASREMIRIAKANALYTPLVVESFDYFFRSAESVKIRTRQGLYDLLDFSTPRLHRITGFDDFPILCPSLTEPFVTTDQYLEFAQLSQGQVALDLGAYAALSSLAFSKAVGRTGRVIALEPDPLNLIAAEANITEHRRVNELANISLLNAALAPSMGTLQFSSEGAMGSALTSITGRHRGETVGVKAVTLQNIAEWYDLVSVDFIKMDIEGSELPVILCNKEFLQRYRPRLIIEPHFIDGELTSIPIINFLQTIGYTCSLIKQTGLLSLPLLTAAY